jgi:DNA-binding GntR family transcriptional regulator
MSAKNDHTLVIEQPVPIRKQVYEHLRNQILSQEIQPSSRLVEAQIAQEIGISRTPVREALHLLEKDGFIESIPRVGYKVKQLDWEELDQIFEIRRINESLACRWAVQKIDARGLKALEKNLAQSRAVIAKGEPNLFLKFDEEFHEILGCASGSRHLLELCKQLRRLMLRYRAASLRNLKAVEIALEDHARILERLKRRDAAGLEKALEEHLVYSKEDIRRSALKGAAT